jgi:hypothetical protein
MTERPNHHHLILLFLFFKICCVYIFFKYIFLAGLHIILVGCGSQEFFYMNSMTNLYETFHVYPVSLLGLSLISKGISLFQSTKNSNNKKMKNSKMKKNKNFLDLIFPIDINLHKNI